jgi:hypothetical protein
MATSRKGRPTLRRAITALKRVIGRKGRGVTTMPYLGSGRRKGRGVTTMPYLGSGRRGRRGGMDWKQGLSTAFLGLPGAMMSGLIPGIPKLF